MDEQIVENIKDPSIADWLIPKFTTTTESDRVVASISMMASLQCYFVLFVMWTPIHYSPWHS